MKRVKLICDNCGEDAGTVEHIERISRWYNISTDKAHQVLWDDEEILGGKITFDGCHVEKVGE